MVNVTEMIADIRPTAIKTCRPGRMLAYLVIGDALVLAFSGAFVVFLKLFPHPLQGWHDYFRLAPLLPVFLLNYWALGLYSGVSLGPPDEVRRLTLSSILVTVCLSILTSSTRGTHTYFTWTIAQALALTIVLVPLTRVCIRLKFACGDWWGYPTVIFGDKAGVSTVIDSLIDEPALGLKPVGFICTDCSNESLRGVPAISREDLTGVKQSSRGSAYAVFVASTFSRDGLMSLIESYRRYFSHILIIPGFTGFSCLWVNPKNLSGMLGLEVCQQIFVPSRLIMKRAIDLLVSTVAGIVLLPLLALIALAIRIDSEGPIFYGHRRVGGGGREFDAWKFRSMLVNADEVLETHLATNPDLRTEWILNRKLKKDPRLTRIGRFIRQTSLDELPQLWNVIRGEMSLVGPRPIVRAEIVHYGDVFATYMDVPSGLTGLWQVSGRNNTTYEQRVAFDQFYVRNWSVWLDFYILFRTIGAVLARKGAF
jgi:Undecaprenyl-phosphate galactose phosphotransferase WbaP